MSRLGIDGLNELLRLLDIGDAELSSEVVWIFAFLTAKEDISVSLFEIILKDSKAKKYIETKLMKIVKELNVKLIESWFIRYNQGGMVYPHNHGNFSWSCVYYVQTGKEAKKMNGSTYFLKPYHPQHPFDFGSNYMQKGQVTMEAEEGKLLVFPGHLFHGSHPFYGEDDRIIISANSYTELKKN